MDILLLNSNNDLTMHKPIYSATVANNIIECIKIKTKELINYDDGFYIIYGGWTNTYYGFGIGEVFENLPYKRVAVLYYFSQTCMYCANYYLKDDRFEIYNYTNTRL